MDIQSPDFDPQRLALYHRALTLLEQGVAYAFDANVAAQQFAVPVKPLLELGLTDADLRYFLVGGLVEHLIERPLKSGQRRFLASSPSRMDLDRSCFVLTPDGQRFASIISSRFDELVFAGKLPPEPPMRLRPRWDPVDRELYWHVWIVKKFSVHADLQETVLQWFQDKGFPERVEDEFSDDGVDRQERMHNAVVGLNRSQTACKIEFYRDGSKTGIRWRKV